MTATNVDMEQETSAPYMGENPMPLVVSFAPNWPARTVLFRIAGTALILSASAMWLFPSTLQGADLTMFKLGTSVFFFFCGLALLMRNHVDAQPDAYFDPIRNEVRVLQANDRGRPQTVLRRSYDSLGSVDITGSVVELFDVDGSKLMKLVIDDENVLQSLRQQLGGQAKIS